MTFKNLCWCSAMGCVCNQKPVSWPSWKYAKHKQRSQHQQRRVNCLFNNHKHVVRNLAVLRAFGFLNFLVSLSTLCGAVSVIVNKHCYTTTSNGSDHALAQRDRFSLSSGVRRQSCVFTVPSAPWHLIFRFKWQIFMFTFPFRHTIWIFMSVISLRTVTKLNVWQSHVNKFQRSHRERKTRCVPVRDVIFFAKVLSLKVRKALRVIVISREIKTFML